MDPALAFLATWAVGAVLTLVVFRLTRRLPRSTSAIIRAFALAATFTPSIILHNTSVPAPAILVLVLAPFVPMYRVSYALLFGAVPIALEPHSCSGG